MCSCVYTRSRRPSDAVVVYENNVYAPREYYHHVAAAAVSYIRSDATRRHGSDARPRVNTGTYVPRTAAADPAVSRLSLASPRSIVNVHLQSAARGSDRRQQVSRATTRDLCAAKRYVIIYYYLIRFSVS